MGSPVEYEEKIDLKWNRWITREKQNKYLKLNLRGEEDREVLEKIYRRDSKKYKIENTQGICTRYKTIRKMNKLSDAERQ